MRVSPRLLGGAGRADRRHPRRNDDGVGINSFDLLISDLEQSCVPGRVGILRARRAFGPGPVQVGLVADFVGDRLVDVRQNAVADVLTELILVLVIVPVSPKACQVDVDAVAPSKALGVVETKIVEGSTVNPVGEEEAIAELRDGCPPQGLP